MKMQWQFLFNNSLPIFIKIGVQNTIKSKHVQLQLLILIFKQIFFSLFIVLLGVLAGFALIVGVTLWVVYFCCQKRSVMNPNDVTTPHHTTPHHTTPHGVLWWQWLEPTHGLLWRQVCGRNTKVPMPTWNISKGFFGMGQG